MSITTTAHLNFRGQARDALAFYASVFGGEVVVFTHEQAGRPHGPDEADQLAFGQVESDAGFRIMAFDVPKARPFERGTESFFVAVRGDDEDEDEVRRIWSGLSEGADVREDLGPAPWSPLYGMLTDRFGVMWVIDLEVQWG